MPAAALGYLGRDGNQNLLFRYYTYILHKIRVFSYIHFFERYSRWFNVFLCW